jgi:hypothetical protein
MAANGIRRSREAQWMVAIARTVSKAHLMADAAACMVAGEQRVRRPARCPWRLTDHPQPSRYLPDGDPASMVTMSRD